MSQTFTKLLFNQFLLLLIFLTGCNRRQEVEVYTNPEQRIAELLMEKRAVMVADFGHGNPAPYFSLLKVLNEWYDLAIREHGNHYITLIWEKDSIHTNKVKAFLNTGNIDSIYNATYSYGSFEDIEFYNNLRRFRQKLDNIRDKKIVLHIKGFEEDYENLNRLSEREGDLWFVNKRDSITAAGVINYMKLNPNEKILIFYGGGHLQDGLLEKTGAPTLKYSERLGYYLAYYLKQEFGKTNILTINQAIRDTIHFSFTPLEKYKHQNILLESKFVPEWKRFDIQNYDMFVLRHDKFVEHPHKNNLVFSRCCIENAITRLEVLEHHLDGDEVRTEYNNIMEKLFIISGQRFANKNEVEKWYEGNNFKGLKRIKEKEFAEQIYKYMYDDDFSRREKKVMNELGIGPGIFGQRMDTSEYRKIEQIIIDFLAFHNAISVYWIGYPDEKAEAKKILVSYSGQDFDEPDKYFQWFRKEKYNANY